jgi:hypothetical protein
MDQGLLAARLHHKQTKESVKVGQVAEEAFLAQREVVHANNALKLYKQQQIQVSARSSGTLLHSGVTCC